MNIEISLKEEQIKQMVDSKIKKMIEDDIKEYTKGYRLREVVKDVVAEEIAKEVKNSKIDYNALAKTVGAELIANKCAERISGDIANAFNDKYDY